MQQSDGTSFAKSANKEDNDDDDDDDNVNDDEWDDLGIAFPLARQPSENPTGKQT